MVPIPIRQRMRQSMPNHEPSTSEVPNPATTVIARNISELPPVCAISPRSRLAPRMTMPVLRQSLLISPIFNVVSRNVSRAVFASTTPIAIANNGAPTRGTTSPASKAKPAMTTHSASPGASFAHAGRARPARGAAAMVGGTVIRLLPRASNPVQASGTRPGPGPRVNFGAPGSAAQGGDADSVSAGTTIVSG